MSYLRHWKLPRSPFTIGVNGRGMFTGGTTEEAMARSEFLVEQGKRLGLVIGPSGVGKTTFLKHFCKTRNSRAPRENLAMIDLRCADGDMVANRILNAFDPRQDTQLSMQNCWSRINDHLFAESAIGHRTVLLLDNVHDVNDNVYQAISQLWSEKTFQSITVTMLIIALWLAICEVVASGKVGFVPPGIAILLSPLRAILDVTQPIASESMLPFAFPGGNAMLSGMVLLGIALALTLVSIRMLRIWNPSRERRGGNPEVDETRVQELNSGVIGAVDSGLKSSDHPHPQVKSWKSRAPRRVWNNPVLWREMRTWAYGRKVLLIRLAYLSFGLMVAFGLRQFALNGFAIQETSYQDELVPATVSLLAPFIVLSLLIINALAVNSVTNERDGGALDLLLVTEITSSEFLFGKICGVLYVTKEMVAAPLVLCSYLWTQSAMTTENLVFTLITLIVMDLFVTMLGIHCGMIYAQSRAAIGTSLGTVFFLFLGIATCMLIMLMFRGSFGRQLAPFLFIILGGGIGLYVALGSRNPSPAITISSFLLPFLTFFAITSFILRDQELAVFSVVSLSYAFATAAMMIPALSEFDFAFGRSKTADDE